MSHFFVGVIIPKDESITVVSELLEPYDENLESEPRIDKTKEELEEVKKQLEEDKNDPDSYVFKEHKDKDFLNMTNKELCEFWYEGQECDDDGNLLTTYNPDSKWDWYVIGGRWNGEIRGEYRADSDGGFNFEDEFHTENENRISVSDYLDVLDKKDDTGEFINFPPYTLVTPDGDWHSKGEMGYWGISHDSIEQEEHVEQCISILNKYKDGYDIVGVDCHI